MWQYGFWYIWGIANVDMIDTRLNKLKIEIVIFQVDFILVWQL